MSRSWSCKEEREASCLAAPELVVADEVADPSSMAATSA
jgi:hypothetical protein